MNRGSTAFYDHLSGFGVGPLPGPFSSRGDVRYFPFLGEKTVLDKIVRDYNKIASQANSKHQIRLWAPSGGTVEHGLVLLCTNDFSLFRADTSAGVDEARSLSFRLPVVYSYGEQENENFNAYIELFPFFRTLPGVLTAKENRGLNATSANIYVPRNEQLARSITLDSRRLNRGGSIHAEDLLQSEKVNCCCLSKVGGSDKFKFPHTGDSTDRSANSVRREKTFLTLSTLVSDNVGQSVPMRNDVLLELLSIDNIVNTIKGNKEASVDPSSYWPEFIRTVLAPIICSKKAESIIAHKQIRDAYNQDKACYQSLVLLDATYLNERRESSSGDGGCSVCSATLKKGVVAVSEALGVRTGDPRGAKRDGPGDVLRVSNACRLRIYKHYSHPIAESLGLEIDQATRLEPEFRALSIDTQGYPLVQKNVARIEECGRTICYRYDSGPYQSGEAKIEAKVVIDGKSMDR